MPAPAGRSPRVLVWAVATPTPALPPALVVLALMAPALALVVLALVVPVVPTLVAWPLPDAVLAVPQARSTMRLAAATASATGHSTSSTPTSTPSPR
ncbi:hypothetical protein FAIPA1_390044 [Frankia sp. AiPs1]